MTVKVKATVESFKTEAILKGWEVVTKPFGGGLKVIATKPVDYSLLGEIQVVTYWTRDKRSNNPDSVNYYRFDAAYIDNGFRSRTVTFAGAYTELTHTG